MVKRESMSEILSRIKVYKSRIEKAVEGSFGTDALRTQHPFIAVKKKCEDNINNRPTSEIVDEIKSEYDSVCSLIDNLRKLNIIKNGVNDTVSVTIAGKKMPMALALSMSTSTLEKYNKAFINKLKSDYQNALNTIDKYNQRVFNEDSVNQWITMYLSQDAATAQKDNPELVKSALEYYHERNDCELVDPINILKAIETLEKEYDDLYNNIGFILSAMNARIIVEYDLDKDTGFWRIVNLDELDRIDDLIKGDNN